MSETPEDVRTPREIMEDEQEDGVADEIFRSAGKRADSANAHAIAGIGVELMNAFNHGKTDPSAMAILGHDTATGFEFCIERNGVTYVVAVGRDWAT